MINITWNILDRLCHTCILFCKPCMEVLCLSLLSLPDGSHQPLNLGKKTIIWQELHENQRNWTESGKRAPSVPPPWIRQCFVPDPLFYSTIKLLFSNKSWHKCDLLDLILPLKVLFDHLISFCEAELKCAIHRSNAPSLQATNFWSSFWRAEHLVNLTVT